MLVNDIIRQIKQLYPSEYDDSELCLWCDEVSSLLASRCEPKKTHSPIRLTRYRGEAFVDSEGDNIRLLSRCFVKGDTLNIGFVTRSGARRRVLYNLPVIETEYDAIKGAHTLKIAAGALDGSSDGARECVITRVVTDETLCQSPHDGMYIDYILAKINLHRRDSDGYSRYISAFNSGLCEYSKTLPQPSILRNIGISRFAANDDTMHSARSPGTISTKQDIKTAPAVMGECNTKLFMA